MHCACLVQQALSVVLAAPALADEDGYSYGGLSVGQSRAKIDDERITANLAGSGPDDHRHDARRARHCPTSYSLVTNSIATSGLKAATSISGEIQYTATKTPAGSLNGQIQLHGLNSRCGRHAAAVRKPVAHRPCWRAICRRRVTASAVLRCAVTVTNTNPSKNDTNYKLGIGLQYAFTPSVQMRAEAEHFRVNDAVGNHGGINMFSVGLLFPFGRKSTAAPIAAATPRLCRHRLPPTGFRW